MLTNLGCSLFLTLSLIFIYSVLNLGVGNSIIPNANALSLGQILNSPTIASQGLTNIPQNVITAQSLPTSTPVVCTNPQPGQGILTIKKVVSSNVATTQPVDTLPFGVMITGNGLPGGLSTFVSQSNPISICLNAGHFTVVENSFPLNTGLTFSTGYVVSTTTGTTTGNSNTPCSGEIAGTGDSATCTITNTITNGPNANQALAFAQSLPTAPTTQGGTQPIITAQSLPGGPTASEATTIGKLINPPFQQCASNNQAATVVKTDASGKTTVTSVDNLPTRVPSAAKYILSGVIPLDKLRNAMSSFKTQTLTIALESDLQDNDGLMLTLASPQFSGVVIAQSNDGARQKVFDFKLDTIRTECKFITLGQGIGPASNAKVVPLGTIGTVQGNHVGAPDIDQELIGGLTVGTTLASDNALPAVLNSPFAKCQAKADNAQSPDNLAVYTIDGDANLNDLSGHRLTVEVTADLVQQDTDLAKIVKTNNNQGSGNNPFLTANLIADESKSNGHVIGFTLHNLDTDCKQVDLTTKSIFKIHANELKQ
jgi:hypothetical protein